MVVPFPTALDTTGENLKEGRGKIELSAEGEHMDRPASPGTLMGKSTWWALELPAELQILKAQEIRQWHEKGEGPFPVREK